MSTNAYRRGRKRRSNARQQEYEQNIQQLPLLPRNTRATDLSQEGHTRTLRATSMQLPPYRRGPYDLKDKEAYPLPQREVPKYYRTRRSNDRSIPQRKSEGRDDPQDLYQRTPSRHYLTTREAILQQYKLRLS